MKIDSTEKLERIKDSIKKIDKLVKDLLKQIKRI